MGRTGEDDAHVGSTDRARRNRVRSSGGFLLDSPSTSVRLTKSSSSTPARDEKGKRKSDEVNVAAAKKRAGVISQRDDGVRSSPLSKELRPEEWDSHNLGEYPVSNADGSTPSANWLNGRPTSNQSIQPSLGYDADPAQIVDMALRLREGRRRQVSRSSNVPTGNSSKRLASVGNVDGADSRISSPFVDHYAGLPSSRNGRKDLGSGIPQQPSSENLRPSNAHIVGEHLELQISKATQARVEKARRYMELAYEHRRLLSHLPPIRRPGSSVEPGKEMPVSKVYNPLQYARNRKLRLREKSALTAEADGWYDVAKVRAWVDAAVHSQSRTEHDPMDCVRLPPLSQQTNEHDPQSPNFAGSPHSNKQQARPRRPKSDWVTHPGELIADAYWLEQGMNKTKILDRDNYPIYPADTQFRYAGWREHVTPTKMPKYLQAPTPPNEETIIEKKPQTLSNAPELPTFKPAHRKLRDSALVRAPKRLKKAFVHDTKDLGRKAFDVFGSDTGSDSDTSSQQSASDTDNVRRGRRRHIFDDSRFSLPVGNLFDVPATSARPNEDGSGASNTSGPHSSLRSPTRSSLDQSRFAKHGRQGSSRQDSIFERVRQGSEVVQSPQRYSMDQEHRTSDEYDIASPVSPINHGLPSITINLSPPHSRSTSPNKRKGSAIPRTSHSKNASREHSVVEMNRSHRGSFVSHSRDPSTDIDRARADSSNESRGNSPFSKARRASSSYDDFTGGRLDHRQSTVSRVSTTRSNVTMSDSRSRIKGIFKGGRIAEIVGNEVSRVGDYIWKREPPGRHHNSISTGSFHSPHSSDSEHEDHTNGTIYKTPPKDARRSLSSDSDHEGPRRSYEEETASRKPRYHNPNLPSFTSPFQRDREKQEKKSTPETSPRDAAQANENDHISLQVAQHRSRSKSPRLDRLAPPKLNTATKTPMDDRRQSYGFGADLTKSQSASQAFNEAIAHGSAGSVTSQKRLAANTSQKGSSSVVDLTTPVSGQLISKQDILRIKALLVISSIKAKSILAVKEEGSPDPTYKTTTTRNGTQDERLSKCSQHILTARSFVSQVTRASHTFDQKLQGFSKSIVANLHSELQTLEDTIENSLTPRARAAADQAGELSMKLTTTSALATKDLNDTISEAFRFRKRGPLRFFRSFAYGAIEWAVVGLLWFIWAVVTAIRLVLGVFKGTIRVTRWLLWID